MDETSGHLTPVGLFLMHPANRPILHGDRRTLSRPIPFLTLLLLVPFLLAGIWVPWHEYSLYRHRAQVHRDPVETSGRLVSERTQEGEDDTSYYVTYRYEVAGQSYVREAEVRPGRHSQAIRDGVLAVRYSRSHPEASLAVGEVYTSLAFVVLWTVIWDGTLLLMLIGGWGYLIQSLRLARDGDLVAGVVTRSDLRTDSDDDQILSLDYCFQDPFGQVRTGTARATRNDLKTEGPPREGTAVAILYAHPDLHRLL